MSCSPVRHGLQRQYIFLKTGSSLALEIPLYQMWQVWSPVHILILLLFLKHQHLKSWDMHLVSRTAGRYLAPGQNTDPFESSLQTVHTTLPLNIYMYQVLTERGTRTHVLAGGHKDSSLLLNWSATKHLFTNLRPNNLGLQNKWLWVLKTFSSQGPSSVRERLLSTEAIWKA